MRRRLAQVLLHEREEHGVMPLAVPQVRLPLDALADVAHAPGVRDRALVERVDLELDTMEAEIDEQMTLEEPRRFVADAAAAKARLERETSGLGDPAPLVDAVEADRAGPPAV